MQDSKCDRRVRFLKSFPCTPRCLASSPWLYALDRYDGIVHVIAGNGGQALNNASAPTPEHPYTGSGCNWTDPAQNCTAAKKLTGHTQGSGTEFGMSYFEANATTLTWSFIGNNDSLAHYTFALHRAYPRVSKKADLQGMSSV